MKHRELPVFVERETEVPDACQAYKNATQQLKISQPAHIILKNMFLSRISQRREIVCNNPKTVT